MSLDSDAALQGFYRFNSSGNVGLDSSPPSGGNGANSMIAAGTGAVTAVSDTVRGSVLQTTVTSSSLVSYLEMASRFGSPTNNVTLAGWVRVTAEGDPNNLNILSIGQAIIIAKLPNDALAAAWWQSTTSTLQILQSPAAVSTGWHHVALTISATAQILYVDGVNVASATFTDANNIYYPGVLTNSFTRIGLRSTSAPSALIPTATSLIDDVRYYSRVLTSGEVASLVSFGATNMNAAQSFTEDDTTLALTPIVVSNTTGATATLTLSNLAAGRILPVSDSNSGASSEFNDEFGVWTASGPTGGVNTLLSRISFVPSANFASNFTISTYVAGDATAVFGSKAITATAVNDGPTATNLSAAETYTQDTPEPLTAIVVTDIDSASLTVTLTLSVSAAGSLSTPTVAGITPTYNAETGVWTATGSPTNLNSLLANPIVFTPATGFNSNFTIATSVSDGSLSTTGTKAMTGIAVSSGAVVCFTADTKLRTANGESIRIDRVRPGMMLATTHLGNKYCTVKSVIKCQSWRVVEFDPLTLHPQQDQKLVASPNHLLYNSHREKWAEACFMEGGIQMRLTRPVQLFNIQTCEGWKTMLANNVLCETCAVTDSEKTQRAKVIAQFKIPAQH